MYTYNVHRVYYVSMHYVCIMYVYIIMCALYLCYVCKHTLSCVPYMCIGIHYRYTDLICMHISIELHTRLCEKRSCGPVIHFPGETCSNRTCHPPATHTHIHDCADCFISFSAIVCLNTCLIYEKYDFEYCLCCFSSLSASGKQTYQFYARNHFLFLILKKLN